MGLSRNEQANGCALGGISPLFSPDGGNCSRREVGRRLASPSRSLMRCEAFSVHRIIHRDFDDIERLCPAQTPTTPPPCPLTSRFRAGHSPEGRVEVPFEMPKRDRGFAFRAARHRGVSVLRHSPLLRVCLDISVSLPDSFARWRLPVRLPFSDFSVYG